MKAPALGVLIILFLLSGVLVAEKNLAEYPLRIQILEVHWQRDRGVWSGWGRGNIDDGKSAHGFDFTYQSGENFLRTIGNARYFGKWKKEPLKLEMLVGEIGNTDKHHAFELKTSLREEVYVPGSGGTHAVTPPQSPAPAAK